MPLPDGLEMCQPYLTFGRNGKNLISLTFIDQCLTFVDQYMNLLTNYFSPPIFFSHLPPLGGTEDIHLLSENVARCVSELMGLELPLSESEFYTTHILHRSSLTRGIYHTDRMKALYIMEDYIGAYSEVLSPSF